jgi:4'-phosphopantetheinyl transferase
VSTPHLEADEVRIWVSATGSGDSSTAIRKALSASVAEPPEGWHVGRDWRGAPVIGGHGRVTVSVSHSGGVTLVAVARGCQIGVDLEPNNAGPWQRLPEHALTPNELLELKHHDRAQRTALFLRYWTLKEALLKAVGVGLAIEPRLIELSAPPAPARVARLPRELGKPDDWTLHELAIPGYVAALAVDLPSVRVSLSSQPIW